MFSFLQGKEQTQKQPNQEVLKAEIKKALTKVCPICNNYSVEEIAFGQDIIPTLTCSKCELKAVGNEPSRLQTNIITVQTFNDNLTRQLHQYGSNKLKPINTEKANVQACNEMTKKATDQTEQIKESYKKLKQQASKKLEELVKASEACNTSQAFERVAEMVQAKKFDQIGRGDLIVKAVTVTDGPHFTDVAGIEESNRRVAENVNRVGEVAQVELGELNDLIGYIRKLQV